jgi:hypothetical protein
MLLAISINEALLVDLFHLGRKHVHVVPVESFEKTVPRLHSESSARLQAFQQTTLTVGLLQPTPKFFGIIASNNSGFVVPNFCIISFFANSLAPSASFVPFKINLNRTFNSLSIILLYFRNNSGSSAKAFCCSGV